MSSVSPKIKSETTNRNKKQESSPNEPTEVSPQLKKTHMRTPPLRYKVGLWTLKKVELAELQKRCYLEEHALKLRLLKEEHDKEMGLQDERLRIMRTEHKHKMKLMQLQVKEAKSKHDTN